ncbi:MAG: ROK family protein [Phycisphaerales bacterium]|nr:ROK family protein [Phycisphaerales bacterium]
MLSLGIDIGGSSVKAALLRDGAPVATVRGDRYQAPDHDVLSGAIRHAIDTVLRGVTSPLDRVGLCAPGLLDRPTMTITKAVNVPGIVGVPLAGLVAEGLRGHALAPGAAASLVVTTDAHATALDIYAAEQFAGRLLCLALGTGVGACVLDDGVPLHVSGETPGHIGHMDVSFDDDPPTGPDGAKGTLESYIGLPALLAGGAFQGGLAGNAEPAINPARLEPALRALARAVRIGHAIYRPQHIRLAGGIGIRLAPFIAGLRASVEHGLTSLARPGWDLAAGSDEFHAARGAAALASRTA